MTGIIAAAMTALVGVVVWYLKQQTKHQIKREDKRDERDAKREEKILNIVDTSLKDMEKTVRKDSDNTVIVAKSVNSLKTTIENHLIHAIDGLTKEIKEMKK